MIVKPTYNNPALLTLSLWDQQQSAQKKVQTVYKCLTNGIKRLSLIFYWLFFK